MPCAEFGRMSLILFRVPETVIFAKTVIIDSLIMLYDKTALIYVVF